MLINLKYKIVWNCCATVKFSRDVPSVCARCKELALRTGEEVPLRRIFHGAGGGANAEAAQIPALHISIIDSRTRNRLDAADDRASGEKRHIPRLIWFCNFPLFETMPQPDASGLAHCLIRDLQPLGNNPATVKPFSRFPVAIF